MPLLGVLGWPVRHSRSPAMHNAALAALGLAGWRYQLLPVPPELFERAVRALPGAGFAGANVTVPHKEAALALATDATPAAQAIGAANTLTFHDDGRIEAGNTDAPGLLASLPEPAEGRTALVLGAGGSARAAAWALREAGAAGVAVLNRTRERADRLAVDLGIRVVTEAEPADILVNCTTVGLHDERAAPVDLDELHRFGTIVDLVYREGGTTLVRAARAQGHPTVDGLEILVGQGALSLERWTGRTAPLEVMRAAALSAR
ncbi:shikimate dehydrogenase [Capillimicrobium parvum]|uniref:Shikimate dehydrogenase (NADP(+)) n=1 Tax=Capillimicrobium parvum TaxID=2884022 RepID=A0A9E6XZ95_9ACTN|nr:shikimate dehydrogenase [Capillimicrobium parvum]UGS37129.1 Shikimate dehydrogenase (NADP(+)) [Capillimicrobium parvum]